VKSQEAKCLVSLNQRSRFPNADLPSAFLFNNIFCELEAGVDSFILESRVGEARGKYRGVI
jgi:hypothetical protein